MNKHLDLPYPYELRGPVFTFPTSVSDILESIAQQGSQNFEATGAGVTGLLAMPFLQGGEGVIGDMITIPDDPEDMPEAVLNELATVPFIEYRELPVTDPDILSIAGLSWSDPENFRHPLIPAPAAYIALDGGGTKIKQYASTYHSDILGTDMLIDISFFAARTGEEALLLYAWNEAKGIYEPYGILAFEL